MTVLSALDDATLRRQTGEAMFLHDTIDGGTLIHIEPNQGARPAAIDLTDIARLKGEGSVGFNASGSLESVFPFGNHAELVWLRQRQIAAALYLFRVNDSSLRAVQALLLQWPIASGHRWIRGRRPRGGGAAGPRLLVNRPCESTGTQSRP
jgi:hypothetical protein